MTQYVALKILNPGREMVDSRQDYAQFIIWMEEAAKILRLFNIASSNFGPNDKQFEFNNIYVNSIYIILFSMTYYQWDF